MVKKTIRINHVEAIEEYLGEELHYVNLERNRGIKGVEKLINQLPKNFDVKDIKKFYKKTGLKVQVRVEMNYDLTFYDRKGKYPRDYACLWNEEFMNNLNKHPEWLEPQEEADIFINYKITPVEDQKS